ncbi:hypothetical protein MHYP_G00210810 [Metynnis hypsauchen]
MPASVQWMHVALAGSSARGRDPTHQSQHRRAGLCRNAGGTLPRLHAHHGGRAGTFHLEQQQPVSFTATIFNRGHLSN